MGNSPVPLSVLCPAERRNTGGGEEREGTGGGGGEERGRGGGPGRGEAPERMSRDSGARWTVLTLSGDDHQVR